MSNLPSYTTNPSIIERIADKILTDEKMSPAKIRALASIIQAVKGVPISEPNDVKDKDDENEMMLSDESPISMSEVTGVSIDGEAPRAVKIYGTKLPTVGEPS